MILKEPTMSIPLRTDENGIIYVGETRITLDTVIACYHQGDTPEAIHEGFPTLSITDLYAVIAYYLSHRDELDTYLTEREAARTQMREAVEANYTPQQRAFNDRVRELIHAKRRESGE
jgi:uncharacterized protein (DUF433 family)